jgi:hypothetical protein
MLTVELVIERLRTHGYEVELVGRSGGGATGGAFNVITPSGQRVLKWQPAGEGVPFERVAVVLERLGRRGCPVPGYQVLDVGSDLDASYQEILQGAWGDLLPVSLVQELVEVNRLQIGQGESAEGVDWADRLCAITVEGAPGWSRHESLEAHSAATRRLWAQVRDNVGAVDRTAIPDGDAVHMDFHHRNVLQHGGVLTGVIDWEGVECGDRRFDLMTLAFYSGVAGWPDERRASWIRDLVDELGTDAALLYLSHLALRSVDWAIRHETPSDVQRWLAWSEQALKTLD